MARKLITPEDIENHNKEGGAWGVVQGKVYDLQALANKAPCGREALLAYAGQDATKAFEAVKHSDFAHEMAQQFLKGTYSEVKKKKTVIAVHFYMKKIHVYKKLHSSL
jgi:cytochrome b involved in lipid metabolism